MKTLKKPKIIIIVLVLTALIPLSAFLLAFHFDTYVLTPNMCNKWGLLGTDITPEQFCSTKGEGTYLTEGYTFAKVDKNGNLILVLTSKQKNAWKNANTSLQFLQKIYGEEKQIVTEIIPVTSPSFVASLYEHAAEEAPKQISTDYTYITETPSDTWLYSTTLMSGCMAMQLFEGKSVEDMRVEYVMVLKDGSVCGKIVWSAEGSFVYDQDGNCVDSINRPVEMVE